MKALKRMKKAILRLIGLFNRLFCPLVPVNDRMALFLSFHGRGYSDNPRAIYEYLLTRPEYQDFQWIWVLRKKQIGALDIPKARVVRYNSPAYLYYLARCRYWVCNCKLPVYVVRKKNQVYLQTWHGTPLKRMAHDILVPEGTTFYRSGMSAEEMRFTYDRDVARYTYMISPSRFTTEIFPSAFRVPPEKLIETGYPRNDMLVNDAGKDLEQLRRRYAIPEGKRVLLYAPTWRDNSYVLQGYTFELKADFRRWKQALGSEYVVLFKPHYLISHSFDLTGLEDFVRLIPANEDIRHLYLISDALVTDYSSAFFDFAILERPIYFYMYDLEQYRDRLRGFYLNVEDLPGQVFDQESDLLAAIGAGEYDFDRLKCFNAYYNNHEDGQASERVVEIVFRRGSGR